MLHQIFRPNFDQINIKYGLRSCYMMRTGKTDRIDMENENPHQEPRKQSKTKETRINRECNTDEKTPEADRQAPNVPTEFCKNSID